MTVSETAPADRYAPTMWGGGLDEEVQMPSGQLCRVKKMDFADIMVSGLMDKLNTLQGVVDKQVRKGQGEPPAPDPLKLMKDRRTAVQFNELLSQIAVLCVTAPKVEMPPEDNDDRLLGVVYADTVGLMDKMTIFTHAMQGMGEMEAFRSGANKPS